MAQPVCTIPFTRRFNVLVAVKGDLKFCILKYSNNGGWEAAIYRRSNRLGMPFKGMAFDTLREAVGYFAPDWSAA